MNITGGGARIYALPPQESGMEHHKDYVNHVRLSPAERQDVLNRLDDESRARPRPKGDGTENRRREPRQMYRLVDVAIEVEHPGGTVSKFLVCTRNLSSGGLSFVHGGFLHTATRCRMELRRRDLQPVQVQGIVTNCRHVRGSLHELGIRFDRPVDVSAFLLPTPTTQETGGGEQAAA